MSGLVLQGRQAGELSGASVSNLGDFNSDGLGDILIGAGGTSGSGSYGSREATSLILGSNEIRGLKDIDLANLSSERICQERLSRILCKGIKIHSSKELPLCLVRKKNPSVLMN